MKRLLFRLFDIREGEGFRATLMFMYIFLIIASLLIIKPVRNSLFITEIGVDKLPIVFVLVALTAAVVTTVYTRFAKRLRLNVLIGYTTAIILLTMGTFWVLLELEYKAPWILYAFYVWVAIFGVISTTQFWLLANYVFNAREAKRLFGFVGAGAISGGIFGGYLTSYLAPIIGTHHLLFFCFFFLIGCLVILSVIWKRASRFDFRERVRQQRRVQRRQDRGAVGPLRMILSNAHLRYLAGIIGIGVIVANLVDYQYSAVASEVIKNEDELTAFFGFWMSNLSILSLVIQLFFTGRILKTFGVGVSLFFLPVGILLGAVAILFQPALWSAVMIKVSEGGLKQSIHKAGLELLALPVPTMVKNQTKAFIDVFVDSLATGIGGVLLIVATAVLSLSVSSISVMVLALGLIWIVLLVMVKKEYVNSFRLAIEKRTIDLEEESVNLEDASVFQNLMQILEGQNEKQILYVLDLLENVKTAHFVPNLRKLIRHPSGEIKVRVLRMIRRYESEDFVFEATDLLEDPDQEVQIEAIAHICEHAVDRNTALQRFLSHENYRVYAAAMLCMAKMYRTDEAFRKNTDLKKVFDEKVRVFQKTDDAEKRRFMSISGAQFIGIASEPALYPYLHILLNHPAVEVLEAAIMAAGETRAPEFVNVLIGHLDTRLVRKSARLALAHYGEDIVETLVARLRDPYEKVTVQVGVTRVLALIGSQKAVNALMANMDQKNLLLRYQIIKALNRLRIKFSMLRFDEGPVEKKIFEETRNYFQTLTVLHAEKNRLPENGGPAGDGEAVGFENNMATARRLLVRAIREKLDANLERIFRLLGLRYVPKEIFDAYQGIVSNKAHLRANAVEFLDNILDSHLKKFIIPIIESNSIGVLLDKTRELYGFGIPSESESIKWLLEGDDNWLKVCALYLSSELRDQDYVSLVGKLVNDSDPTVRETAKFTVQKIQSG